MNSFVARRYTISKEEKKFFFDWVFKPQDYVLESVHLHYNCSQTHDGYI